MILKIWSEGCVYGVSDVDDECDRLYLIGFDGM